MKRSNEKKYPKNETNTRKINRQSKMFNSVRGGPNIQFGFVSGFKDMQVSQKMHKKSNKKKRYYNSAPEILGDIF